MIDRAGYIFASGCVKRRREASVRRKANLRSGLQVGQGEAELRRVLAAGVRTRETGYFYYVVATEADSCFVATATAMAMARLTALHCTTLDEPSNMAKTSAPFPSTGGTCSKGLR